MPRIFISYRRDDAPGQAGRLYDRLKQEFGDGNVFIDVDTLLPGDDFVDAIGQTLGRCDLMIAVIGPGWLSATDAQGRLRLEDPADFVRVEVQKALERQVRTVPVLVNRAAMPHEDQLPDPLKPLIRRQAVELSDARWSSDVRELVDRVKRATSTADAAPAAAPKPANRALTYGLAASAVIGAALLGLLLFHSPTPRNAPPSLVPAPASPAPLAKSEPPPAKSEPATAKSEPAHSKPEPTPAKSEPAPAKPSPAAAKSEPAPAATSSTSSSPAKDRATKTTPTPAPAPSKSSQAGVAVSAAPTAGPVAAPSSAPSAPTEAPPPPPRDPCDTGDAEGCMNLAQMYEVGRGVPRDPQRAATLYQRAVTLSQRACDANTLRACTALGVAYAGGIGVPRNDARAVALYQRACDGGEPAGCHHLGQHYERGLGVSKKDPNQARALYQRACEGGAANGCTDLGRMFEKGAGVPKDPAQAAAFYQRGCSGGDTVACDALKWLKK
jgi:TPR repeat protein